mgnify:CR=1 FL=1
MTRTDFIHPEDETALRQLEAIPGFSSVVKKFLALGYENMYYGMNMASSIRLSETQLPHLYKHLPPICQKLGIAEPEFYLQMDPCPNAWTFGDTRIFITITSGLVESMTDDELDAVIAHECGHILCKHVLYHTMAQFFLTMADNSGLFGKLTIPVQYALWYWFRKSELSCDRVASYITTPKVVASTMARLAGGPKELTEQINLEEWAKQADLYDGIYNSGFWDKTLQILITANLDHPFAAVRVREIFKWSQSVQYKNLINNPEQTTSCPNCQKTVDPSWQFCKYCGTKIK